MSTKYKVTDNERAYFITTTIVGWVDLFTRKNHRRAIIESLRYCQNHKGLEIYAYVLMPSHLHMLCSAKDGFSLTDIMRDFKKFTANKIIQNIKREPESRREWLLQIFSKACEHLKRDQVFKVWQNGFHAEMLLSNKFIFQKLNYIHNNPVADGIVEKPEDYLYSSARNYAGMDALLNVELLTREWRTLR